MKTIALLVGINEYNRKPLRGCLNDVKSVEKFLTDSYQPENLKIKTLLNAEATRQGFIDAFVWFEQANDGDTCLLYYSGHGSYMTAAKEFWTETDRNLETLVLYDSRRENGRDLANKELGFLIWQYTRGKNVNFVVITDSCHSGSVTRELFDEGKWLMDRIEPMKSGITPVEDFYGFDMRVLGERGYIVDAENEPRKVSIQVANHIHLAASRNNQTAKEDEISGEHRGIFTYSLLRTLMANNAKITYQNLISSTSAKVKTLVSEQDPSLNIIGLEDGVRSRLFLNTELLKSGERIYTVFFDKDANNWVINGGAINDLQTGDKVLIEGHGDAFVAQVKMDDSSLTVPTSLDKTKEYNAKVTKTKRIPVSFDWSQWQNDWKAEESIKQRAKKATDFYITEDDSGMFFIHLKDDKYFLSPKNSNWAMFKAIDITSSSAIDDLVDNIDKVSRWYLLKDLTNPKSSINESNLKIKVEEIGVGESTPNEDGYFYYYKFIDGKWKAPKLKITLKKSDTLGDLDAKPLHLGFNYSVDVSTFNTISLKDQPQNISFTNDGKTKDELALYVDPEYQNLGYNQITEYLKIFVSTKELVTDGFWQEGIEMEQKRSPLDKDLSKKDINERGIGRDPDEDVTIEDWQVFTLKLIITMPTEANLTAGTDSTVFGLNVINNSNLNAKIGFSTTDEIQQRGFRDVETSVPLHKTKGNDIFQPAELLPNSGQGQSLNVIEIFNPDNPESVNEETPLIIKPGLLTTSNETIIPFGFDPDTQTYFPLGGTNSEGNIVINALPPETPSDALITQRSFLGSLKIYFYKVVGQKIGLKYDYPQLSIVEVAENEKVTNEKDQEIIEGKVKNAEKIILFIHGIIGDTEEMVKAVRRANAKNGKLLVDEFDLVLAFDYENLNTKIQQTAADLKDRLTAIGLGDNHGKELVIVAHSMGGLVSRYFIEKLGGNKIVNHLVMLGTPNGGSEWADVRDLAEVLLTTAVNGAAFLKPWIIPLSFIGKLFSGVQITLQQMNDNGNLSILTELNDGTNTSVPYTIVAGNTQLIGGFVTDIQDGVLKKVIARIKEKPAYAAMDLLIFRDPNDIAIKVINIKTIAGLTPVVHEVASDHISYFGEKGALEKLGRVF